MRNANFNRSSTNLLTTSLGALGALTAATVGGWLTYSAVGVDHSVALPLAMEAAEAEQRSFVSEEAGEIFYYADTRGEGRPLVLVHSINAAPSSYEMKPLFEHYQGQRPVYALDLPGFGFSERGERIYTPALYQAAIRDLLRSEVGEAADVIALSLSSEFAATVALAHGDLVNSLVLISPTGMGAESRNVSDETSQRIYRGLSFPLWAQPLYDLLTVRPGIRYFLNLQFAGQVPDDMVDYGYATSHQPDAKIAPFHFLSAQLFTWDIREAVYERLSTPTLVLFDEDPNVNFDGLDSLRQQNPAVQATRIQPTMGLPHWEKLPETVTALDEFWSVAE